jgi:hypothetical protein
MSERVTWETCPGCGGLAAVGWQEGAVTEFDCSRGCDLTTEQQTVVRQRAAPPLRSAEPRGYGGSAD